MNKPDISTMWGKELLSYIKTLSAKEQFHMIEYLSENQIKYLLKMNSMLGIL